MSLENPSQKKEIKNNTVEVKKETYKDLIDDFGYFITLNASKIEQDIIPGKEEELKELRMILRQPIINGLNYSDFVFKNFDKLNDPIVAQALITQIYKYLQYIEPRLNIFKQDTSWVKRFEIIKQKYINLVSENK
jgi:sulfur carrier protein ThiS